LLIVTAEQGSGDCGYCPRRSYPAGWLVWHVSHRFRFSWRRLCWSPGDLRLTGCLFTGSYNPAVE